MVQENIQLARPVLAAIRRIADDRQSGAAEILKAAANVFALLMTAPEAATAIDSARRIVLATGVKLVEAQPEMAPLINLASHVVAHTKRAAQADEVITTAEESARDFFQHADVAAQATTAHALELIGDGATVLTHSRSSTVLAALLSAHRAGRYLHVMATESRPLFEGRALAETLAGEGMRITLIAEAAAALAVKRADFVLFGADRVTPDGLVNKIGTHMIALAAVCEAKLGRAGQARQHAVEAAALKRDDSDVVYKLAVVQALAGDGDAAMTTLTRAIGLGYPRPFARGDWDLASLAARDDFKTLTTMPAPGTSK